MPDRLKVDAGGTNAALQNDGSRSALAGRRRRSVVVGMQAVTESIKEKQARARDQRETRRIRLGPPHKHVIQMAATHLQIDAAAVEEFVLDSEHQMRLFDQLFAVGGSRVLMFYYQEAEVLGVEEIGRNIPGHAKGSRMMQVFLTDGRSYPLQGICVYFNRANNEVEIKVKNVAEEISFGVLDVSGTLGILKTLQNQFTQIFCPALMGLAEGWGILADNPQGKQTVRDFLNGCKNFNTVINNSRTMIAARTEAF